ncbi:MAG TPA: LptF/LptG family permease [bacterium]|nr:LptF/LptG family permease [bacterium]
MKVLDRYVLRELFFPILYCSLTLVSLILIADLFDNLDELLRHHTPFSIFLRYYFALIPFAFVQIIPWAAWLGTLYLLINFGFHNELLAMKVAGLKIMTIVRPILFIGFLIGIFTFFVNDRIVPVTQRTADELREVYIEKKKDAEEQRSLKNVTYYGGGDYLYFVRALSLAKKEAEDMIILSFDKITGQTRRKISARKGLWTGNAWELEQVTEHPIDARGRIIGEPLVFAKKIYPDLQVPPQDIANASRASLYLSYREMKRSMTKLKASGVNVYSEMVDLYERLATPWQSLVMMLIAIPIIMPTRTRKGIAASILVCIGLVFAYHVISAVGLALGKAGKLFPFLSAWLGNIVFTLGALTYLDRANH